MNSIFRSFARISFILLVTASFLRAQQSGDFILENGTMWTFDNPPVEYFTETYGFTPDEAWFEDVRLSALRFAEHCSASFISREGLVMTNFHCGLDAVDAVTREGENLRKNGFHAATLEEERPVPGLFVEQLVGIEDVTDEVVQAMSGKETVREAFQARDEVIEAIESRMSTQDIRCQVVTFYNGARYSAYTYRHYNDVRLVFSSELSFAFFGGIYDFWSYPRYSFDCDLFRVYENGEPLKTERYYRWSTDGPENGEPIFVVGNPGSTGRLVTAEMLEFERDLRVPYVLQLLENRKEILETHIRSHPEEADAWFDELFGIVNGQEAYHGRLLGLRDDELIARRHAFDEAARSAVEKDPTLREHYDGLWKRIADLVEARRPHARDIYATRMQGLGVSDHIARAGAIAMWREQMSRPEDKRSRFYQGQSADMLRQQLTASLEVRSDIERMTLERQLKHMRSLLGADDPLVRTAFQGEKDAAVIAQRMLDATVLADSAAVAAILDGNEDAENKDPFMQLATAMLERGMAAAQADGTLSGQLDEQTLHLGRALYDIYGARIPPDATFTLRISDGLMTGYEYNGTIAPPFTTFNGMFDRYESFRNWDPAWDAMMGGNAFELPEKWKNVPERFDPDTPMNFASTCDIVGGNSGSPVINREKEIVGLAFDGNIESLAGSFIFAPDKGNRTISVHSSGILEALRHVYGAARIVREIEASR
ncbi:MAG: S46 family peptidase [Bacteroidetes bacterium]|nr:S46 family peptidase [Bacteroidota bacterium]